MASGDLPDFGFDLKTLLRISTCSGTCVAMREKLGHGATVPPPSIPALPAKGQIVPYALWTVRPPSP